MSFMDHLGPQARARLEEVAERIRVPRMELVIHAGETDCDFYRIEEGSLEVVDRSARPELVLDVLGPGTVVGEMSFLTGDARSADVRAGEDCGLLKWSEDSLHAELRRDPKLAASFYRASARLLAKRLRAINAAAASGGLGSERAAVPEEVRGARALADKMKGELLQCEAQVRRAGIGTQAEEILVEVWESFIDSGRRLFAALSGAEAEVAGKLLAQELSPYLIRSHLAELAITRRSGHSAGPALLAHVETGQRKGADPLGEALDYTLQRMPTPNGLRDRILPTIDAIEDALPERAAKVMVLNVGPGTTIARLVPLLANTGGEITAVDNDSEALAFLNSASVAPLKVELRVVPEDLARIATGVSLVNFGPQDVIVCDGLIEYLPDRVVATLFRALLAHATGGSTLVLNLLLPSEDAFVFDRLLQWPTIRRDRAPSCGCSTRWATSAPRSATRREPARSSWRRCPRCAGPSPADGPGGPCGRRRRSPR